MRELLRQKIVDSLAAMPPEMTLRDVRVPAVRGKAVAVIGPRRAGKTTFLWQVVAQRLAGKTPREQLLYFNFEDERLAGLTAEQLHWIVEEYYRLQPGLRDQQRVVFLLDEIQSVSGWEKFARRVQDSERVELYLSGSSARLLSREVATSMRGRAMEALVLPFSFREFLRHRGVEPVGGTSRLGKARRSELDAQLRRYLSEGGFPEAQGIERRDRFELLRGYIDTAMLRDVIERHGVTHPVALRWLVRQLLGNAGGLFSIHRFYGDLRAQGIPVAKDTLHQYLSFLEDAFMVHTIPIAAGSERRRRVNPRKSYPIDTGLIAVFDRTGRSNLGHALETTVALELERRGAETAYVRTADDLEVDFLVHLPGGEQQLIQVSAELDSAETVARETRALLAAAEEHPQATLHVITLTSDPIPSLPAQVAHHSAATWLLEPP